MKGRKFWLKPALVTVVSMAIAASAHAHHGFGLFELETELRFEGVITGMDFVNPHSYLYFDRVDENGNTIQMRCEMRAATLLRRSGWSEEMFEPGLPITLDANPHRDDPTVCYTENLTIGDRPTINRNQQFSIESTVDTSDRALVTASGDPNISGDWAVEQKVLTVPPSGGRGSMVLKRFTEAFAAGEITLEEMEAFDPPAPTAVYTARGQAEADAFEMWSVEDNPRLSCNPQSIIYDWVFDWPVNRITQTATAAGEDVIDMDYGLYSFFRRINLDMDEHPANLEPSNAGHSIGRWYGNMLVVDTAGFEAGVLRPPTRNSEEMRVIERYTLDTDDWSITREYSVTDPVYLAEPYEGWDIVYLSDVPYEKHECVELTPEFIE